MRVQDLFTELFYTGAIGIARVEGCDGNTMYVVDDDEGNTVFFITEENFKAIAKAHTQEHKITAPCGCIFHYIVPQFSDGKTVLFDPTLN